MGLFTLGLFNPCHVTTREVNDLQHFPDIYLNMKYNYDKEYL